jgi:putative restriction endonuclease
LTQRGPVGLANILGHVLEYCRNRKLPPLTVLVVNSETGEPGAGFTAARDIPAAQMKVFAHDWLEERPPTPEELAEGFK